MAKKHEFTKHEHGGKGITGWIRPTCSCGWKGQKHYAHNDWQCTNAREEFGDHARRMAREENGT